jgi:hypothetical protein
MLVTPTMSARPGHYDRDETLAVCRRALLGSRDGVPNEIMVLEDDVAEIMWTAPN